MVLKMSRARRNDVGLIGTDATSAARRQLSGISDPKIFSNAELKGDPDGTAVSMEIPLPPLGIRQAWNAQDPLASVHHYLVFMYVVLPALFGLRMCFNCPDCNADENEPGAGKSNFGYRACSDYLGSNSKLLGGFAGLATGLAFATEFQGDGTPHGHGFISLANMYQHNTLEDIKHIIESNQQGLSPQIMLVCAINWGCR